MQPVLLGRSFAPLQGETGLCTAEIPSNHQTTRPPKDYCGGKDKGIHFSLAGEKRKKIGAEEKVWVSMVTRLFLIQTGAHHSPHSVSERRQTNP